MVLGIIALIVEVAVLGFGSIVLFFVGLSLCISGTLMMLDILAPTMTMALWSNALLTGTLAVVLWKPLKRMQATRKPDKINSDFARDAFVLEQDVHLDGKATHRYSGIDWKLKSKLPLKAGTRVVVDHTEVGVMWLVAADSDAE